MKNVECFSNPGEIAEQVYDTIVGTLTPEYGLPWVEEIFVPGHPCYEEFCRMSEAYARLRGHLGVIDEDPDAEIMIDSLLAHGKIIAMEMFRYGIKFERMRNLKTE